MANLILLAIILTIFCLIAFLAVSIRFIYDEELIIHIDLLFLSVILYPARNKKPKKKNTVGFIERLKIGFRRAEATKSAIDFLLKKSTVSVNSINVPLNTEDPSKLAVYSQHGTTLILMLMSYLSLKAEAFTSENDAFFTSDTNALSNVPAFDITIRTALHVLFSTLIIYNIKKRKRRQENWIVRNKNE